MAPHGLNKLSALMPESETRVEAFLSRGFVLKKNLRYFERKIPVQRQELEPLSQLGGRILARDLWENVAGMRNEKELLERRLVLPLAEADLADEYGVVPPRAVVLFGPPGTGKTTFAKAIASRLEWPFVEVFPSRLASDPKGLAGALRETFLEIAELEHAVVFIDEVEEIASQRPGVPRTARPTAGLCHELYPGPGLRVPAPRPLRLRHPDRPAGPAGPRSHVAALYPGGGGGRRGRGVAGGPHRGLLPRGHRIRGPQRLPARAGERRLRNGQGRRGGFRGPEIPPGSGPEGSGDAGLPRRDRGHPDHRQRRGAGGVPGGYRPAGPRLAFGAVPTGCRPYGVPSLRGAVVGQVLVVGVVGLVEHVVELVQQPRVDPGQDLAGFFDRDRSVEHRPGVGVAGDRRLVRPLLGQRLDAFGQGVVRVVGDLDQGGVMVLGDVADPGLVVIRVLVQALCDPLDDVHGPLGNAHVQQRLPRHRGVLRDVVQVPGDPDVVIEVGQRVADGDHVFAVGPLELVLLPVVGHLGEDSGSLDGKTRPRGGRFTELWF